MTAFWILATGALTGVLGLSAAALGLRAPWAWGTAGVCVMLPGLVWTPWFELGVRAWNKGVRLSTAALRAYVLRVCYYLLFGAVSRAGSSLDLVLGQEKSRWVPYPRSEQESRDALAAERGTGGRNHGLVAFAGRPGNAWEIFLLPVVLLLRLLREGQQESAPSASSYTLY